MILKLKDRTEVFITGQEAEAIQRLLDDDGVQFVHIGKNSISKAMIAGIFEGGLTEADIPTFDQKALEASNRCRGQYSIQCEINNIAFAESKVVSDLNPSGLKWQKLIADLDWRERVRQQLRAIAQTWCDYRAGECSCEPAYLSTKSRHPSWT